jgi:hypothetical protein
MEYLGSFKYRFINLVNTDNVISFFIVGLPFFIPLVALAKNSRTMLNRSGSPCLIPDFRRNVFSFSPLSVMLAIGLFYVAFIM